MTGLQMPASTAAGGGSDAADGRVGGGRTQPDAVDRVLRSDDNAGPGAGLGCLEDPGQRGVDSLVAVVVNLNGGLGAEGGFPFAVLADHGHLCGLRVYAGSGLVLRLLCEYRL